MCFRQRQLCQRWKSRLLALLRSLLLQACKQKQGKVPTSRYFEAARACKMAPSVGESSVVCTCRSLQVIPSLPRMSGYYHHADSSDLRNAKSNGRNCS